MTAPKEWNRKGSAGKMVDTRVAWTNLPKFDALLFVGTHPGQRSHGRYGDDTPPVRIEFRVPGKRNPTIIDLTNMTAAELYCFEEFILHAVSKARPVCETLDRMAQEAFDNGDDGFERLYRPLPQFVDRERGIKKHGPGIQSRLEGPAAQQRFTGEDGEGDAGEPGSAAPDESEGDVQSEHDQ